MNIKQLNERYIKLFEDIKYNIIETIESNNDTIQKYQADIKELKQQNKRAGYNVYLQKSEKAAYIKNKILSTNADKIKELEDKIQELKQQNKQLELESKSIPKYNQLKLDI